VSSSEIEESGGGLVERAKADSAKRGWFGRILLFLRQVVAELKKVVTPTRKELINYTLVVIGFVVVMMALVWVLDLAAGAATLFIFGTPLN